MEVVCTLPLVVENGGYESLFNHDLLGGACLEQLLNWFWKDSNLLRNRSQQATAHMETRKW